MSALRDIYPPVGLKGYPTSGAARWSTTLNAASSGIESRNQNWRHPLHRYTLAEAVRDHATFSAAQRHWMAMRGPFYSFPFRDPLDFASRELPAANFAPDITPTDVVIGVGNGVQREFQLVKPYRVETGPVVETYERPIYLPVVDTVLVAMNGLPPETNHPTLPGGPYEWDVTREGGVVTFDHAPAVGVILTAGFLFDVPGRFESDDAFSGVVRNYRVSGFSDIVFVETRPC